MSAREDVPSVLEGIVGEQLSSVEFVADYLQIHFDGSTLTIFNPATVVVGTSSYSWDQTGYCGALRGCIGRHVRSVTQREGEEMCITLEGGAHVLISLRDEHYRGPEALVFKPARGAGGVVVW